MTTIRSGQQVPRNTTITTTQTPASTTVQQPAQQPLKGDALREQAAASTPTDQGAVRDFVAKEQQGSRPAAMKGGVLGQMAVMTGEVDIVKKKGDARPLFLERPATAHDNETWERMTASKGTAYDVRMAGRAIDTNLLHELARYGRDPAADATAAAELAGQGVIDSKAFEQITNNTNFGGWKAPLQERIAFALAIQGLGDAKGSAQLSEHMGQALKNQGAQKDSPPLEMLAGRLGADAAWKQRHLDDAGALLKSAKEGKILESPVYARVLRDELKQAGKLDGGAASFSAGALLAYKAGLDAGMSAADAVKVGARADKGELDVATFKALVSSPSSRGVVFQEEFANNAVAPRVSPERAAQIASDVAKGELSYGQLHGFMMKFGAADDGGNARITVDNAVAIVKAVNRGEISVDGLTKALDMDSYFPSSFASKIWDRMFDARDNVRGNKYTVSGIAPASLYSAPLSLALDENIVKKLASSDTARATFARTFREHVEDNMPSAPKMLFLQATRGKDDWERGMYGEIAAEALKAAKASIGM